MSWTAAHAREWVAIGLMAAGASCVFLSGMSSRNRYLAIGIGLTMAGGTLFHWLGALCAGFLPAVLLLMWLRDRHYERHYPVFAGPVFRSLTDENGDVHHLHIGRTPKGFVIGIDYPLDVDGTPSRLRTRWKDRFPDAASAARELLARHARGVR